VLPFAKRTFTASPSRATKAASIFRPSALVQLRRAGDWACRAAAEINTTAKKGKEDKFMVRKETLEEATLCVEILDGEVFQKN
jgi:hypothetical protein